MAAHLLWIYLSYFLFALPAFVVFETGHAGWGFVVLCSVPAFRIARRFDERNGYFVGGRSVSIDGSCAARPDIRITRKTMPMAFAAFLTSELAVFVFLLWSVAVNIDLLPAEGV